MLRCILNQINAMRRRLPPAPIRWSSGTLAFALIRLGAIAVIVTVTACSDVSSNITNPDATHTMPPDSTPSHTPEAVRPIFFPQQAPIVDEHSTMTGDLFGKLIVVDNCLRVNTHEGNTSYVVVWPSSVTMRVANDMIQILNSSGQVVAQVGNDVYLDGGGISASQATALSQQPDLPIDTMCSRPYWLVGNIVEPNRPK